MLLNFFLTLGSLLFVATAQDIIDFGLTDDLQKTFSYDRKPIDVRVEPPSAKEDYLAFPGSCSLDSAFSEKSPMEVDELLLLEEQKQLTILKQGMKELFSLSEQIKISKKTLLNLTPKTIANNDQQISIDPIELSELELLQNQLRKINETIGLRVEALRTLILQELNRTKENSLDQVRLKFELAIEQSRLNYLIALRESLVGPNKKTDFQSFLSEFFGDVEESIWHQKKELATLQALLDGFANRQELKIRISNLQNQLQATNLMIKEKESCDQKKGELHNRQNKKQFEKIYNELKNLKSHQSANTSYCEGVARLLEKQLKKILRVYNYSFSCSQGLSDLQNSRIVMLEEVQRLKHESNNDDYNIQSNRLKHYFERQQQLRQQLIVSMNGLKLSPHEINRERIQQEITIVREHIEQIQYRLAHPPESQVPPIDYSTIRQMVGQIEQNQHQYCQLKQQYISKYRGYDVAIRSLQHRALLFRQQQQNFHSEVSRLRSLQQKFQNVRRDLLRQIE